MRAVHALAELEEFAGADTAASSEAAGARCSAAYTVASQPDWGRSA